MKLGEEVIERGVLNPHVDEVLSILDREKARLDLTNGELLVLFAVGLGGLLADADVKEFDLAMDFLLQAAKDLDTPTCRRSLHALLKSCEVAVIH